MSALLRARELSVTYTSGRRGPVQAVRGVSLTIGPGEILGLVGESGSGKSTLGKALLRLVPLAAGTLEFEGRDLGELGTRELRAWRSRAQLIPQQASASLNPGLTVRQLLEETIRLHRPEDWSRRREIVVEALTSVRLAHRADARPAWLSGGEKRRVGVLRALLPRPALVVADEPTAGLDASVKADVLGEMLRVRSEGMAYLFISHELDTVRYVAGRVLVMFAGRIVEELPAAELRAGQVPEVIHPYTERLLRAGFGHTAQPVQPADRPPEPGGCPYRHLCHRARPGGSDWRRCTDEAPRLVRRVGGRRVACHLFEEDP